VAIVTTSAGASRGVGSIDGWRTPRESVPRLARLRRRGGNADDARVWWRSPALARQDRDVRSGAGQRRPPDLGAHGGPGLRIDSKWQGDAAWWRAIARTWPSWRVPRPHRASPVSSFDPQARPAVVRRDRGRRCLRRSERHDPRREAGPAPAPAASSALATATPESPQGVEQLSLGVRHPVDGATPRDAPGPALVTIATSGRPLRQAGRFSPRWFIPHSTTAYVLSSRRGAVKGTPTSLFRLPSVSASALRAEHFGDQLFVLVLP